MKILIVDDDNEFADDMTQLLGLRINGSTIAVAPVDWTGMGLS